MQNELSTTLQKSITAECKVSDKNVSKMLQDTELGGTPAMENGVKQEPDEDVTALKESLADLKSTYQIIPDGNGNDTE